MSQQPALWSEEIREYRLVHAVRVLAPHSERIAKAEKQMARRGKI